MDKEAFGKGRTPRAADLSGRKVKEGLMRIVSFASVFSFNDSGMEFPRGDEVGQFALIVFSSFFGGFIQAVTGFGGGVIIMIFLPFILSMTEAPAISDVITMMLSFSMFWRYRRWVRYRSIILPAAVYLVCSTLVIHGSAFFDTGKLKVVFGLFLIVLAIYFIGFSGRLSVKTTLPMKLGCGGLAGVCGGLFGISGPPASLFYLAATKSKEEYLGTLNAFFSITVVFNIASRIYNGFITPKMIPLMAAGVGAILVGCVLGSGVVKRLPIGVMQKCVYGLMAFAGVVTVLQGVGARPGL